ncbi:hypothetical protein H0H92_015758 [Tricholoma furcatifolium]|nr:hypothetical protein H0H92_015758 [Tricholoma furcatifolium]
MATLPRASRTAGPSVSRQVSEFDAGINTSAAWTEHFESEPSGSLSDDDIDHGNVQEPCSAWALYDFRGKSEFKELDLAAGDVLDVLKEDLADGWSLVKDANGKVGLVPRNYYTFTPDLESAEPFEPNINHAKKGSSTSITPRGSPKPSPVPIVPQSTGEWISSSFRHSLFGGKSLNRFSSFVTSGAEEFLLRGTSVDFLDALTSSDHRCEASNATIDEEEVNRLNRLGLGESDRHFIDAGPTWKEKIPLFRVLVHSPIKRTSAFTTPYTVYALTSLFEPSSSQEELEENKNSDTILGPEPGVSPINPTRITVYRRFSHFVVLHATLTRRLPGIALPPLPEKQYAGRFSEEFIEARRGDLEQYLNRVVRHPVARYAEVVTLFLGCENDVEWDRMTPQFLAIPAEKPSFYTRVFHPAFNVDVDEAQETIERFESHTKAVGKGVDGLRTVYGRVREARIEMSKAERLLSYSLLSMITAKPLESSMTGVDEADDVYDVKKKGLSNEHGAWCWRENCQECLKLTKAVQRTAETLQHVADSYDDHARRTQLATQESLKAVAHPASLYEPVVTTHKETLARYQEATREGQTDEELAARCETVLNTTMSEIEVYHNQKVEDFTILAKDHLDGEIQFYEQILSRLRAARRNFDQPLFDELAESSRQCSIYERELENPRLTADQLPQPFPHVFDSAPMRPVSAAIQEGFGILLGPSPRGSGFGRFW